MLNVVHRYFVVVDTHIHTHTHTDTQTHTHARRARTHSQDEFDYDGHRNGAYCREHGQCQQNVYAKVLQCVQRE